MNGSEVGALVVILAIIVGCVTWYSWRKREFGKLDPDVQSAVRDAREARKQVKAAVKQRGSEIAAAGRRVSELSDAKGGRVAGGGGVTVYQRWIETKQGSGSIIGVTASAADESTIRQRLTATRMVAFGVFALAAPKKKTAGTAYVVIEGPSINGVATFDGQNDPKAGPHAYELAAAINTQARQAAHEQRTLPQQIESAKERLAVVTGEHDRRVQKARAHFESQLAAVPEDARAKYFSKDRVSGAQ